MMRLSRAMQHRSGAKRGRQLFLLQSSSAGAKACAYACLWTTWTAFLCSRNSYSTTSSQWQWQVAALTRDKGRTFHRQGAGSSITRLQSTRSDDGTTRDASSSSSSSSSTKTSSSSFTTHSCISDLLREFDYDAFILDQFGVLHNGKDPLDGALDCVRQISSDRDEQKRLLLTVLSNTSSPAKTTLERLHTKLGFDRSLFVGAVTSGEEAARYIRDTFGGEPTPQQPSNQIKTKKKFIWCTWDPANENVPNPLEFLELCGPSVEPTVDVEEADFVVAHGSGVIRGVSERSSRTTGDPNNDDDHDDDDDQHEIRSMGNFLDDGNLGEGTPIHDLLLDCAKRNLPLVCANPDEVVVYHDGGLKHMPGKIAKTYASILREGSENNDNDNDSNSNNDEKPTIRIFGKPHKEHFEACLRELQLAYDSDSKEQEQEQEQEQRRPLRVAHVGDSLHHDVAGANAAGVPSIFVVGGIHSEELLGGSGSGSGSDDDGDDEPLLPTREALEEFFAREGHTPTHVVPTFRF